MESIVVKLGKKKITVDPDEYLEVDLDNLNNELAEFPQKFYYIQNLRNRVQHKVKSLTHKKQIERGDIFVGEKTSTEYDKTPTDKYIEGIIQTDEDYIEIKKQLRDWEKTLADLNSLVEAMSTKGKFLQSLNVNSRALT